MVLVATHLINMEAPTAAGIEHRAYSASDPPSIVGSGFLTRQ